MHSRPKHQAAAQKEAGRRAELAVREKETLNMGGERKEEREQVDDYSSMLELRGDEREGFSNQMMIHELSAPR